MSNTWISPWSGKELSVEELLREVALDAFSHYYVLSMLGLPDPEVWMNGESLSLNSPSIDYSYGIHFPRELSEEMEQGFGSRVESLRKELCMSSSVPKESRNGEEVGSALRYFNALDRLIRICIARQCWDLRKVLVLHGITAQESLVDLTTDLDLAGISYLLLYPRISNHGTGLFVAVDTVHAIELVNRLWHKEAGAIEDFLQLRLDYGQHLWVSNNNRWAID